MTTFQFQKNNFLRDDDVEGSGGTTTTETTTTETTTGTGADGSTAALEAAIKKAVDEAVAGLKKKNDEVIGNNKKLKDENSALKTKPTLTEEEYTEFKILKEKIERDEFLRLFAEGKSDEVIERVTRKTRLDAEAKLAAELDARTKVTTEAADWKARYEQTLVNVEIAKATASTAVKPQYTELVSKLVAERVKLVEGTARIVNAEGEVEMTANGTAPLSIPDYIETLRGTYADLFVASSGGGASGSNKKPAGTSTKVSLDAASNLSMEDYMRLRGEGKI
jgi:hypothetical protein